MEVSTKFRIPSRVHVPSMRREGSREAADEQNQLC